MDAERWEGELLASSLSRVDGGAHWAYKGCICASCGVLTSVSRPMSLAGGVCVPAEPRGLWGPGGKVSSEHHAQSTERSQGAASCCHLLSLTCGCHQKQVTQRQQHSPAGSRRSYCYLAFSWLCQAREGLGQEEVLGVWSICGFVQLEGREWEYEDASWGSWHFPGSLFMAICL